MSAVLPITADPRFRLSTATAAQTSFSVPFPFQDNLDIAVIRIDGTTGEQEVLVEGGGYTLTGAGAAGGGAVTLTAGAVAGDIYLRVGQAVLARVQSILRAGKFRSRPLDDDIDRFVIIAQELQRETDRALKVDYGQTPGRIEPGAVGSSVIWGDDGGLSHGTGLPAGTISLSGFWQAIIALTSAAASWILLQVMGHLTTRTAIKALIPVAGMSVSLSEPGREGDWNWRAGDYSVQVAADTAEIGYLKADTIAATAGAFVRVIDGPVNARWAGTVGDGITDDTAALQAWLLFTAGRTGVLPPASYLTSQTLLIKSGTTIFGFGATLVASTTLFPVYAAMQTAIGMASTPRPILSNNDPSGGNANIKIHGLKWTGNPSGPNHGLMLRKVTGGLVSHCETYECESAIMALACTDLTIEFNKAAGFRNAGIDTFEGNHSVRIVGNEVDGTAPNSDGTNIGIFVTSEPFDSTDAASHQAQDYVVAGNIVHNIESNGIWIGGGDNTANRLADAAKRIIVADNVIRDIGGIGIVVDRSVDVKLSSNTILNCGNHGILTRKAVVTGTARCDRVTICNNDIVTVGAITADSKFIHMDDLTRDARVYGNRGFGTGHTYALYDRGTNDGLLHYGNKFSAGSSGTYNILGTGVTSDPNPAHLSGSAAWNPASVANGAQTSTTLTVTGAAIADRVWMSASGSLGGLRLWGEVTAADTVTIFLGNTTGGAVDLGSLTYTARVEHLGNLVV